MTDFDIPPGETGKPLVALAIAGFDPSSGAGVTADLQVFAAHGLFGTSAITALTVQSTRGVKAVQPVNPSWLRATLEDLQDDLPPAGIKIGMLGSAEAVTAVAAFLRSLPNRPPVVLDPVLRASSGAGLLTESGLASLQTELLPLVDWVTPNWSELGTLSGMRVLDATAAAGALAALGERFPYLHIVATGGDQPAPVDTVRLPDGRTESVAGEHIPTRATHGTGCAFSSALLCALLAGLDAAAAVRAAKRYVEGALRFAPVLGHGRGPMQLLWPFQEAAWSLSSPVP